MLELYNQTDAGLLTSATAIKNAMTIPEDCVARILLRFGVNPLV
jgi:hypothetical protein